MDDELRKIMIPMIRRVLPSVIAHEIVGAQPMGINKFMGKPYYITKQWELAGSQWYLLELTEQVKTWLTETFVEKVDYSPFEIFEGQEGTVVTAEVYTLLKLKWA